MLWLVHIYSNKINVSFRSFPAAESFYLWQTTCSRCTTTNLLYALNTDTDATNCSDIYSKGGLSAGEQSYFFQVSPQAVQTTTAA